jgi:peroxiredoxin
MKIIALVPWISLLCLSTPGHDALAAAEVGRPAPSFEVKDASGKAHRLADYAGKWLVLEWFNPECPYVRKHYGSGNMQSAQKQWTAQGVSWLSVSSSAKGRQGYLEPDQARQTARKLASSADAILLDADGRMGKAYGAKVTPHMFVIDPKGRIAYAGAIDDNDDADPAVIPKSRNYVSAALAAGLAGKPIEVSSTRAYGCGVHY